MPDSRETAVEYAHTHRGVFLNSLKELLEIPSVSTDPTHQEDMPRAARWLADRLQAMRFKSVRIIPTPGHPVVVGELAQAGNSAPTILIYGHYDVQPPDPVEQWHSGPFEPVIRGENLVARGASDMKGQIIATLSAIESVLQTGDIPVNIKALFEGEEEIGSPNMAVVLAREKEHLACDLALNPDAGMSGKNIPTIVYGLRGMAYFELRIDGPAHDLHSGQFGGIIHNPAQVLCEVIAGLHDRDGKVTIPGFYDRVARIEPDEKAELARLSIKDKEYLAQTGAPALYGESEFSPAERMAVRPTLEVNGMGSGFTGPGLKTIIPASAMAKLSMRLVPDQDPDELNRLFQASLAERVPPTARWKLDYFGGGPASITDRTSKGVKALAQALKTVWGKDPVFKREGGSIPVVLEMQQILGVDSVLTGFSLPDDNIHSPDERLHLPTWERGIDALIHFLYNAREGVR